MIPYNRKLERNKFEIILVFLKWILLDFTRAVALFALFEFLWTLFDFRKSSCRRKSISENFDKQKKMTHEYKNQIMCIDSLIKKKKYDSLESFVNKISGQISKELDFICTNNVISNLAI